MFGVFCEGILANKLVYSCQGVVKIYFEVELLTRDDLRPEVGMISLSHGQVDAAPV